MAPNYGFLYQLLPPVLESQISNQGTESELQLRSDLTVCSDRTIHIKMNFFSTVTLFFHIKCYWIILG